MNKANLLLSTAVGLAFVVAGPAGIAASGKKHAANGAKKHMAVDFARLGLKQAVGQRKKTPTLKEAFLVETWGVTTQTIAPMTMVFDDAPQKIKCKNACTVVTNNTAQLVSYYSYDHASICPVVDGVVTNGGCYFSGSLPIATITNIANQTNLAVSAGTHTVQTYLYVTEPSYLGHYQNDYHVYE